MLKRTSFAAFALALLLGFVGNAQSALSQEPINVSNTSNVCSARGDCRPAMVVDHDDVYLAWTQTVGGGESTVMFTSSSDAGETFAAPQAVLPMPKTMAKQPALALLSDGTVLLAWSDDRQGAFDVLLTRSDDGGATWRWDTDNDFLNLSENRGNSTQPALAVGGDDTIVVAWSDDAFDEFVNPNVNRNIFMRTFNEVQGPDFTQVLNISDRATATNNASAEHPSIAINPDNSLDIFVVWEQTTFRTSEIFFNQSTPFASPINLSNTSSRDSHSPVIVFQNSLNAGAQQLLVLWMEHLGATTQIFSNSTLSAGVPFEQPSFSQSPFNFSQVTTGSARAPAAVADGDGNVFVVWEEQQGRNSSSIRLRTSFDPFAPPDTLTSQADTSHFHAAFSDARSPAIAVDGSRVFVAWVEKPESAEGFDVFFVKRESTTF